MFVYLGREPTSSRCIWIEPKLFLSGAKRLRRAADLYILYEQPEVYRPTDSDPNNASNLRLYLFFFTKSAFEHVEEVRWNAAEVDDVELCSHL